MLDTMGTTNVNQEDLTKQIAMEEESASQIVADVMNRYLAYDQHWRPVFLKDQDNTAAVLGRAISDEDVALLKKDDRPVVNINLMLPAELQRLGSSLKRRRSQKVYPVDNNTDPKIAEIINKLFKHVEQVNHLDYKRYLCRAAAMNNTIAWYYLPIPSEETADLEIWINWEPSENILADPSLWAFDDPSERRIKKTIIHRTWMTISDILETWNDIDDDIKERLSSAREHWSSVTERLRVGVKAKNDQVSFSVGEDAANISTVRDQINDKYLIINEWSEQSERNEYGKIVYYVRLRVVFPYVNYLLGDYDLPITEVPFVPLQNMVFGTTMIDTCTYAEHLRPLQDQKNRQTAIAEDAASRAISESIITGKGESKLAKDIKDRGNKPGIYEAATDTPIAGRINSVGISLGTNEMLNRTDADYLQQRLMPPAVGGFAENQSESGTYFNSKVQQGEQTIESWEFIESEFTEQRLWRLVLERIQIYWNKERVFRILGDNNGEYEDVTVNQFDAFTGQILNDLTVGKCDIVIDDVESTKTVQMEKLKTIAGFLKDIGSGLPPQVQALFIPALIENLPFDNRMELAQQARELLAQLYPSPQINNTGNPVHLPMANRTNPTLQPIGSQQLPNNIM